MGVSLLGVASDLTQKFLATRDGFGENKYIIIMPPWLLVFIWIDYVWLAIFGTNDIDIDSSWFPSPDSKSSLIKAHNYKSCIILGNSKAIELDSSKNLKILFLNKVWFDF